MASKPVFWLLSAHQLLAAADVLWAKAQERWEVERTAHDVRDRMEIASSDPAFAEFVHAFGCQTAGFLLYGLAVENALKALRVKELDDHEQRVFLTNGELNRAVAHHDLPKLARESHLHLAKTEVNLLARLGTYVVWAGRYPFPIKSPKGGTFADAWKTAQFNAEDRKRVIRILAKVKAKLNS